MPRWLIAILVIGAFGIGTVVGAFGLLEFASGDEEPTRDIAEVAPTLSLDDPTPTRPVSNEQLSAQLLTQQAEVNEKLDVIGTQQADIADLNNQINNLSNQVSILSTGVADSSATLVAVPTATPTLPPTETALPEPTNAPADVPAERALFRISQDDSEVRFRINETLAGTPNEVVGRTTQVAGDIIINYQDPSLSTVGTVAINARTLRTDNSQRNDSIRSLILESSKDEYEFITFEPSELIDAPTAPVNIGDTVEFQIRGNLTIKDVTREVTFDVTITADAQDQITGFASTQILYTDFGISVNPPPLVAGVEEEVILELEFVATQVEE